MEGFINYVNGYGQFAEETIEALKTIGALKKADLLEESLKMVNSEKDSSHTFRKMLVEKRIPRMFSKDDLFEPLDKLDIIYYSNEDEDIELLLGYYLQSH